MSKPTDIKEDSRLSAGVALVALAILVTCPSASRAAINQQAIDDVAGGLIETARASWWGFDPEESTEALQAAIDSGAKKVILENMGKPWIVNPIRLASNQELVFEEGVEVLAKRGAFRGVNDVLFSGGGISNVTLRGYGATLRMWRSDYAGKDYKQGEWRHLLQFSSCANVRVYGLTLTESGGDGIYLGGNFCRNVHIKDVTCDRNHRQGISVITAENLLIENCVLKMTSGTPPMCGIDFEPNYPHQRLVNCVMRNCVTTNNASAGYTVAIGGTEHPVSLRFENCRSAGDAYAGVSLDLPNNPEGPGGAIDFVNCTFEQSRGSGVQVKGNAAGGIQVTFEGCAIVDPFSDNPKATPVVFVADRGNRFPVGSVDFGEMRIREPRDRRPISFSDMAGVGLKDVSGTLLVEQPGGEIEKIAITDQLIAEWMPAAVIKEIPRLSLEGLTLRPVAEGAAVPPNALGFAALRGEATLLTHAGQGDRVALQVKYAQVARYHGEEKAVSVVSPSGRAIGCPGLAFKTTTETGFEAPETGVYRLTLSPGANIMFVVSSTHPLLLSGEKGPVRFLSTTGMLHFWVPAGTERFGVRVSGEGIGEAVRARLLNPAGEVVEEVDNAASHQFVVNLPEPSTGEAWSLVMLRPTQITLDDQHIDLRGIPPLLAGAKEALLRP